jgi:hypothetical protein
MSTKVKRLGILGAGPAGLLAAHAAALYGVEQTHVLTRASVFDPELPAKSPLYGCQYLHSSIPGLSVRSANVAYELRGTPEDYRRKVYGPESDVRVSPEDFEGTHRAWDIRSAYSQLWAMYVSHGLSGVKTTTGRINADNIEGVLENYDLVISTIPAPALCSNDAHDFRTQDVWAVGDAPDLGINAPVEVENNKVVCNGLEDLNWYRASTVFGMTTVEWSGYLQPVEQAVRVRKPIDHNCDCWETRVVRMGRYGAWRKGILAHEVFENTRDLLTRRGV